MAMELSQKEWKLGFSVGPGQAPRLRSVSGRDLGGLMTEIQLARERFRLGKDTEEAFFLDPDLESGYTPALLPRPAGPIVEKQTTLGAEVSLVYTLYGRYAFGIIAPLKRASSRRRSSIGRATAL